MEESDFCLTPHMLQVAYEVSSLIPARPGESQTGLGRVTWEVVKELVKLTELRITAVACFEGDLLPWVTDRRLNECSFDFERIGVHRHSVMRSRTGFSRLLLRHLNKLEELKSPNAPLRLLRAVMRKVVRGDSKFQLPVGCQIFHSPFQPLPKFTKSSAQGVGRVITIHDCIPIRFPRECPADVSGKFQQILASIDEEHDWVVTNSQFTKQEFCSLTGFAEDRVTAAPLAAGTNFHNRYNGGEIEGLRSQFALGDQPFMLSVANPQPRKNIPRLVHAFYDFLRSTNAYHNLVLVGNPQSGWGCDEISKAIQSDGQLSSRVIVTGAVTESQLAIFYRHCTCFLFPSLFEGFGLPALEAMASGAPVIVSNNSSLPEVCGDAAIYVNAKDQAAIAHAMSRLLHTEGLATVLRANSLAQSRKFSWSRTAECTARAYAALAERTTRQSVCLNPGASKYLGVKRDCR